MCLEHDDATTFLTHISTVGENSDAAIPPTCVLAHRNIEVLTIHQTVKAADSPTRWSLVEVRAEGVPVNIYILTGLPVFKGQGV